MIWKTPVVEDGLQRMNTTDESTTAVGTEEEGATETNTTDLTEDIIVQVPGEEVDFITRRRVTEKVATITTTAIAEEEGVETITMTTTPWRKAIVTDLLTTTSLPMGTIVSTTITAVDTRSIIGSPIT
jgi:hypothetical protein